MTVLALTWWLCARASDRCRKVCMSIAYLLLFWVAASPFISNLINIPKENPFFGSYRIVDYMGYLSGPAKHFVEMISFDRSVLILLFLSTLRYHRREMNPAARSVQLYLGLFTVVVFFCALFSENVLNALRKAVDTFGLCYLAFIIGKVYFEDDRLWRYFLGAIIVLGITLGITCYLEYQLYGEWNLAKYGDAHRVAGPFRYWETLGMTVALIAFVCYHRWATTKDAPGRLKQILYLLLGALMLWCVFRTQTRTIMIAVTLGLTIVLMASRGEILTPLQVRRLVALVLAGCVFLLIMPELLTNTRFYRSTINRDQTREGRQETYVAAGRMFLSNPLFGIGLKNFIPEMRNYIAREEVSLSIIGASSCHSSYLVVAAECGLAGLLPLGCLIVSAFRAGRQLYVSGKYLHERAWGIAMLGMTAAYFYCGTTFDPFFDPTMQNQLYFMCLGCTAARLNLVEQRAASGVC